MDEETWQEFFDYHGEDHFAAGSFHYMKEIKIEDMYQHFKARMVAELGQIGPDKG